MLQASWDQKKQDNPEQPKDAWSTEIKKHFKVPSVMLKTYNEIPLTLFGEIPVTIENAGQHQTVVAVQDEAPQELLLGTDVLSHLGVQVEVTPPPPEDTVQEAGNLVTESWESSVAVKLLDTVRIPAGFEQPFVQMSMGA